MPSFAVLITNFNHGKFLRECIDSALQQSRPPDEIIVCDNGSTDTSVEILKTYGEKITLIEAGRDPSLNSRHNAANSLHRCFARSQSDWCLLLDSDDYFAPAKIATLEYAILTNPGHCLFQSTMQWVDENGKTLGLYRDAHYHTDDPWRAIRQHHDCDFFYPSSALCVHRSVLDSALPFDFSIAPQLASDTRIGIAALFHGRIFTLENPLVAWRRHSQSLSQTDSTAQRFYLFRQTLRRAQVFNHYAQQHEQAALSTLRNPRIYKQILGALLPLSLRDYLRKSTIRHQIPATASSPASTYLEHSRAPF